MLSLFSRKGNGDERTQDVVQKCSAFNQEFKQLGDELKPLQDKSEKLFSDYKTLMSTQAQLVMSVTIDYQACALFFAQLIIIQTDAVVLTREAERLQKRFQECFEHSQEISTAIDSLKSSGSDTSIFNFTEVAHLECRQGISNVLENLKQSLAQLGSLEKQIAETSSQVKSRMDTDQRMSLLAHT